MVIKCTMVMVRLKLMICDIVSKYIPIIYYYTILS